ncbi:hypothetical protein ACS0TY_021090 [Phlomoides rotata]
MALRRTLSKRLFYAGTPPIPPPSNDVVKSHCHREFIASPDSAASTGFLRRFLQRRAINNHSSPSLPSFLTLPVGEKLREKLMSINAHQRPYFDELSPAAAEEGIRIGVVEAKRVLRFVQMEQIREKLRNIPASSISYDEFVAICGDASGNRGMSVEFAKALDKSGNVIVLGGIVFLHPDQVAKSMERVISESIAMPNDPRRKELENLEKQKARIDEKARSIVRGELYCGLGFLVVQTLGFMRLTFWELSWDVMEPICFFVASIHFAAAYLFFLTTSKQPSFESYFHTRFTVKQNKLMKTHNFDIKRYNQLCEAFYPNFEAVTAPRNGEFKNFGFVNI